jgi:Uma2 family endonuclease
LVHLKANRRLFRPQNIVLGFSQPSASAKARSLLVQALNRRYEAFMAKDASIVRGDDGRICYMARKHEVTVEDLYHVPENGKAEIIDGELVLMTPAGGLHGYTAGEIFASLLEYARRTKRGVALPDNIGFIVNLPNRRSFSPDVAFWTGAPLTAKFLDGAPIFAVEVRSEEDYGPAAERVMAAKRTDYFAAGTLVVWDVDTLETEVVHVYRSDRPTVATTYGRTDRAEAEPALPGWSMPVADLFPTT